jgi:hypothetical protein
MTLTIVLVAWFATSIMAAAAWTVARRNANRATWSTHLETGAVHQANHHVTRYAHDIEIVRAAGIQDEWWLVVVDGIPLTPAFVTLEAAEAIADAMRPAETKP